MVQQPINTVDSIYFAEQNCGASKVIVFTIPPLHSQKGLEVFELGLTVSKELNLSNQPLELPAVHSVTSMQSTLTNAKVASLHPFLRYTVL